MGVDSKSRDGVLYLNSATRIAEITDGTSNTLLVGERPPSTDLIFGWWFAGYGQDGTGSCDVVLGAAEKNVYGYGCPAGPYTFAPGNPNNQCDQFHYWSNHTGGANFLLGDASVRFLSYSAGAVVLPLMATRSGGEVLPNY